MLDSKELFEIKELCVKLGECSATYYLIQLMNDLDEANARITRLNREVTVSELKKCGMQGLAAVTYLRAMNALIAKRDAAPPAAKEEHA